LEHPFAESSGNFDQEVRAVKTKAQIATGATVLALAGLGGVALSANNQQAADVGATKPLVRTKVIHRTIHVTKHAKPKHPSVGGAPPGATPRHGRGAASASGAATISTGTSSSGSSEASGSYSSGSEVTTSSSGAATAVPVESGGESAPVTTSTSGASAAPAESGTESTPVTTATSGAGGGASGGGESEGGDGGGEHDD